MRRLRCLAMNNCGCCQTLHLHIAYVISGTSEGQVLKRRDYSAQRVRCFCIHVRTFLNSTISTSYWLVSVPDWLCTAGSPHHANDVDGTIAHQQSTPSVNPSTQTHWRENGTRHMAAQQAEQNSSGMEEKRKNPVQPDIPRLWPVSKEMSEVVGSVTRPCRVL